MFAFFLDHVFVVVMNSVGSSEKHFERAGDRDISIVSFCCVWIDATRSFSGRAPAKWSKSC